MSNEYNIGVISAKLSNLLTETDFSAFSVLNEDEKLTFFINHNLVSTNIVTNFEAMCAYALDDLKAEVSEYLPANHLYLNYFFARDYLEEEKRSTVEFFNESYDSARKKNHEWLTRYLELNHALLNLMTILRGKNLAKSPEELKSYYLRQTFINEDAFSNLISGERSAVFAFIKTVFNLEVPPSASNLEVEALLDQYKLGKLKEFAFDLEFEPTLIYYIKMKEYEILRLRAIYYTKEARHE